MSVKEKILEGKYNYFSGGSIYTEENFRVEREGSRKGNLTFYSEVLSRVKTGEFLKIYIEYEVTSSFDPVNVSVVRQLGPKESKENFQYDHKSKAITYIFETEGKKKIFEKIITALPHVAAPCFLTTMIMVNQKKIDPVQRTSYTVLTSKNIWNYESEFTEGEVYIELQDLEPQTIIIDDNKLKATHCKILQIDGNGTIKDLDHTVYLSRHFYIPYLAKFGDDIKIEVDFLKHYETRAEKFT
jgi:hypothetical protein